MSEVYEIHTSMSEELIVDELCQMKKKFAQVGPLTAKRFSLLVLPPSHESGRRRSGGLVQLVGSIKQQGDENCIQVKTQSGVGFIIPMILVGFFILGLAFVIAAGDRSPELLAPIGFLIVFSAAFLYMRKKDAKAAEAILREHFEGTDRAIEFHYTTQYTKEQCMEFMKHENVNDIYEYEWREERTFCALVIKNYKSPDFVHDFQGRQEWGLIVRFREEEGTGTLVDVKLVQTPKIPFIHNRAKIDGFWNRKLGAV